MIPTTTPMGIKMDFKFEDPPEDLDAGVVALGPADDEGLVDGFVFGEGSGADPEEG